MPVAENYSRGLRALQHPEMKLVRAIHDAPSILDRFSYGRERFILKVRIMADLEDRIGEEMRRVRCETALFEA